MLGLIRVANGEPTGWIFARSVKELRDKASLAGVPCHVPEPKLGGKVKTAEGSWLLHYHESQRRFRLSEESSTSDVADELEGWDIARSTREALARFLSAIVKRAADGGPTQRALTLDLLRLDGGARLVQVFVDNLPKKLSPTAASLAQELEAKPAECARYVASLLREVE